MSKRRIIFILLILLFFGFYIDFEVSNYEKRQFLKQDVETIKGVTNRDSIEEEGYYIAQGTIEPTRGIQIYDLKTHSEDYFVLDFTVEIFQREKEYAGKSGNRSKYRYVDRFVEEIPDDFSSKKVKNPNFETWPIPYKSTLIFANDYLFRDSLKLDKDAFNEVLKIQRTKVFKYHLADFDPPPSMMNKSVHKVNKGVYFYGKDPGNPEIGDIKMKMHGFSKTDTTRLFYDEVNYTLFGEYEKGHFKPFYNQKTGKSKYYFWTYTSDLDNFAKVRGELRNWIPNSTRWSMFLARLALIIIIYLILRFDIFKR